MTTHYFNPEADVNGDGTSPSTPFNVPPTLDQAGDVLLIARGTTYVAPVANPNYAFHIEADRIHIGAYGNGHRPIINCAAVNRGVSVDDDLMGWVVEDLEISNVGQGNSRLGIFQNVTGDVGTVVTKGTIRRCKIHGVKPVSTDAIGIQIRGAFVTIEDCEIFDVGNDAIWFKGIRGLIRRNRLTSWGQSDDANLHPDGLQLSGDCGGTIIEDNYIDARGVVSIQDSHCIIYTGASDPSAGIKIRRNRIYQREGRTGWTGILLQVSGSSVDGNFIYGGSSSVNLSTSTNSGTKVRGNVILNGYGNGITVNHTAAKVSNNVVIGQNQAGPTGAATGIRHGVVENNTEMVNNIVVSFPTGILRSGTSTNDYNCVHDCASPLNGIAVGNNKLADPQLGAGYRVSSTSPCLGAGVYKSWARDGNCRKLKSTPDIGMFQEYAERSAVETPRASV